MKNILLYLPTVLIILCRFQFPSGIIFLPSKELPFAFLIGTVLQVKDSLSSPTPQDSKSETISHSKGDDRE